MHVPGVALPGAATSSHKGSRSPEEKRRIPRQVQASERDKQQRNVAEGAGGRTVKWRHRSSYSETLSVGSHVPHPWSPSDGVAVWNTGRPIADGPGTTLTC